MIILKIIAGSNALLLEQLNKEGFQLYREMISVGLDFRIPGEAS